MQAIILKYAVFKCQIDLLLSERDWTLFINIYSEVVIFNIDT